ncbi:hypothetical protein LCGC14_0939450 [marine sediment metagenome]|uniref:Phage portal protein n=1 Tax=marine sediment metagenome TaxID=412755 RepID=A0A0F9R441_9ZZZZ
MEVKKEIKKGKVFVQTSKGVYPLSVLQKAESAQSSKQLKQASNWRCVNQLAIDVAGLGWSLQLYEGKKENKIEFERSEELLRSPNSEESIRTIFKQLLIDWGSVGWFGLEVVRNNKGEIAELYHVPAHTLRVHESKDKYCQKRNNKKVWFKKFGLENDISSKDGKDASATAENKANELIFYKNFYPKSDFYGVPNAISATGDILGLIGLRDYNLAFFENYGIPSAIITLEGDWDEGSDKKVTEFLNKEVRGTENAHRTLVVTQPEGCKFVYKPIGVDVKESSFKMYEQTRKDAILIAYSMPPERVGVRVTGSLGGNVAEEATRIYVQGVVEPLQTDLEDIVNDKLLQSEVYEFKFENIDLRDIDTLIKQYGYQIERGMMTPNESRNKLGLPPYPEGDKFYMMSSLIEADAPEENLGKIEKEFLDEQE